MMMMRVRKPCCVYTTRLLAVAFGTALAGCIAFAGISAETPRPDSGGKDVIALVDGRPVYRDQMERRFDANLGRVVPGLQSAGMGLGIERVWSLRLEAFEQVILDELLLRQAESEGIRVSQAEIEERAGARADEEIAVLKVECQRQNLDLARALGATVAQIEGADPGPMGEAAFREWLVRRMMLDSDILGAQIAIERLRESKVGGISATEQDALARYECATVRQILVGFQPAGKPVRTDDEARARARELVARATSGADFSALARAESDDRFTARTGGAPMEPIKRGVLPPEIENAVFSLKPGEISAPTEGSEGYWIYKLESLGYEFPPDYDGRPQQLLPGIIRERQQEAWRDYQRELRRGATVEVPDSEILAYQALDADKRDDAMRHLRSARERTEMLRPLARASLEYQLAVCLSAQNLWQQAADAYAACDRILLGGGGVPASRVQALLGRARACQNLGNTEEALSYYQQAGALTDTPSIHEGLLGVYRQLDSTDLIQQEEAWLRAYRDALIARARERAAQERAASRQKGGLLPLPGDAVPALRPPHSQPPV